MRVDSLISAKKIYTLNQKNAVLDCVAVSGGLIVDAGSRESMASAYSAMRHLDLDDSILYPGFLDPHCHFLSYGLILQRAWLFGARSWEEAVQRLEAHRVTLSSAARAGGKDGEGAPLWIQGRGWDQNLWPGKEFPTKAALDRAFPREPVLAIRVDGHAAIANSRALEEAGIGQDTRVEGGGIVRSGGIPTGLLLDNAVDLVKAAIPPPDEATLRRALLDARKNCLAAGLTCVSNAGTEAHEALLMRRMVGEGALDLGLYVMLMPTRVNLDEFASRGPISEQGLSIRSFKMFADGALGSRGARLIEPYADAPGEYGLLTLDPAELDRICGIARESGFQMNVHAIGDAAAQLVLDVFEKHLQPGNDLRWRLEHAQLLRDGDIRRMARLGVVPSVQTSHATSDMAWTESRLGPERMVGSHRYRDLLDACGWLANGSDFPIEGIDPLRGFRSAVFRQDDEGKPQGGYRPGQALSRLEALKAMTIWAARANFEESFRGSIEPGKLADFTALDTDLLHDSPERIREAKVRATLLSGQVASRSA